MDGFGLLLEEILLVGFGKIRIVNHISAAASDHPRAECGSIPEFQIAENPALFVLFLFFRAQCDLFPRCGLLQKSPADFCIVLGVALRFPPAFPRSGRGLVLLFLFGRAFGVKIPAPEIPAVRDFCRACQAGFEIRRVYTGKADNSAVLQLQRVAVQRCGNDARCPLPEDGREVSRLHRSPVRGFLGSFVRGCHCGTRSCGERQREAEKEDGAVFPRSCAGKHKTARHSLRL